MDQDIDQTLLQQFSCLGTTDHDELVNQLQKILGNQLNYTTARFFLDMNNWNLQAAVGCYFDYYSGQKLPSMQVMADVTVGEGECVTPNTRFTQSWKVQNNGDEAWPYGCFLKLTSVPDCHEVHVPALSPGEHTIIHVSLTSPSELGSFQTKWRLCTPNGSYFGDTIWSIVQVADSGTLALTQQLSELRTTNSTMDLVPFESTPIFQGPQLPSASPIMTSGQSLPKLPPPPFNSNNEDPDEDMC